MAQDVPDFLNWHINQGLPAFARQRRQAVNSSLRFFNFAGLIANFFTPYRRLYVPEDRARFGIKSFFDRLSFNLISRAIGASLRTVLLFTGLIGLILWTLANFLLIAAFATLPIFSYRNYRHFQKNSFFEKDFTDSALFVAKLKKTALFRVLSRFLTDDFVSVFDQMPAPSSLGTSQNQSLAAIIKTLAEKYPPFVAYLQKSAIKTEYFDLLVTTLDNYLTTKPQIPIVPIGQMFSFGYTPTLDKFSTLVGGHHYSLTSEEKVIIELIEKVLTRNQNNNILLVGEPGVGRHTVIENLSTALTTSQIPTLTGRKLVYFDVTSLASGSDDQTQTPVPTSVLTLKANFEKILSEAKEAGNIILVIDNLDRIVTSRDDRLDFSEVLAQILRDNALPIIGITTTLDFNDYIRTNPTILKLFEKIAIRPAIAQETLSILIGKTLAQPNLKITLDSLVEIVLRADKLLEDRSQPQKSLMLFDDVAAEAQRLKVATVNIALVDQVVAAATKTPLGQITKYEAQKLTDLEKILHQRIIGQNEAIDQISRAMRRSRAEIETAARPIGSFLFLGPTGVGKTETAKALAEAYFGSEETMVRFDMSEFHDENGLLRLIGNAETKLPGVLATKISQQPYGLLLLDEFEKASVSVHNLFLQVFEEGHFTDAFAKKINFDNIIIIATSNAGAEFIREEILSSQSTVDSSPKENNQSATIVNREPLTTKLIGYVLSKGLFTPELINRFDAVVVYHPLTSTEMVQVANLMLIQLAKKLKETRNITLEITKDLAQLVAQQGFDPAFGARPIRRLIADRLQDPIAKMIIEGSVKNGDKIAAATLLQFL